MPGKMAEYNDYFNLEGSRKGVIRFVLFVTSISWLGPISIIMLILKQNNNFGMEIKNSSLLQNKSINASTIQNGTETYDNTVVNLRICVVFTQVLHILPVFVTVLFRHDLSLPGECSKKFVYISQLTIETLLIWLFFFISQVMLP